MLLASPFIVNSLILWIWVLSKGASTLENMNQISVCPWELWLLQTSLYISAMLSL